jgi:hypothetical protein
MICGLELEFLLYKVWNIIDLIIYYNFSKFHCLINYVTRSDKMLGEYVEHEQDQVVLQQRINNNANHITIKIRY